MPSYVGWLFGGCKFPSRLDPQSIFDSADDLLRAKTFGDDRRNTILLLVFPPLCVMLTNMLTGRMRFEGMLH